MWKILREFNITNDNRESRKRRCCLYVRSSEHIKPDGIVSEGNEAILADPQDGFQVCSQATLKMATEGYTGRISSR